MNKLLFLLVFFITSSCSKDFKTIIVSNIWEGGEGTVDHYEFKDNGTFIHTNYAHRPDFNISTSESDYSKGQGEWSILGTEGKYFDEWLSHMNTSDSYQFEPHLSKWVYPENPLVGSIRMVCSCKENPFYVHFNENGNSFIGFFQYWTWDEIYKMNKYKSNLLKITDSVPTPKY
tara:strand:- start:56 stop:577 length:522 start_codon:yes stop_codon:yes gene_type:complete